jgi:AAA domain/DnaB-like helicase N terminal domain
MVLRAFPGGAPPNELDAEAAVLSAIILEPASVPAVRAVIEAKHWYADRNRHIYLAVLAIVDRGTQPDAVTLAAELRTSGRLDEVGGTPYLAQIIDATPAVAHVEDHARLIVDAWAKRRAIDIARRLVGEVVSGVGDVEELLARATSELGALAGPARASGIEVVDADAIFAELQPPTYLFAPVLTSASVAELVAYGSSGKTWIAVDAVLSVGAGLPWLGRFPAACGRALYLDWENGTYELRRRFHAAAKGRDVETPVPGVALASMPNLYMSADDFAARVEPLADGRGLIVLDTLRAASPGVDENDSRMRGGLDSLHRVAERTGCAFLVLAHAKKTSATVQSVDPREAGRGSSAIFDAADAVLHVTYVEGEPLRVAQTKARSGRVVAPFVVEVLDTANGGVHVRASDAPASTDATSADRFEAACRDVLEAVRARPGSSGKIIRETLDLRNTTVGAAIERLVKDGAIRNAGSKADPKWFPTGPGGVVHGS